MAFGFGCDYMAQFEEQGIGLQWDNIWTSSVPEDDFSMLGVICVLLADGVIYFILAWYIEAVFPGELRY